MNDFSASAHLDVTAANGVPFRVTIHPNGRNRFDSLVENHGAIVAFSDLRFVEKFGPDGQFVSSYYTTDLLERSGYGLNLDGGIDDWTVDADTMNLVRAWVEAQAMSQAS